MTNISKIEKLNQYFYKTPEGQILKYKKYCIISNCEKIGSFNYDGVKDAFYCNGHKTDDMINTRKGYILCKEHNIPYLNLCKECDKMDCLLCEEIVNKKHYFEKSHIDNFDKNITIKTKKSIKNKFIDIIFDFHIIDRNIFYKDLYFKDKVKNLILKNCDKNKNYKISIYKYNQSIKDNLTNYWIEKFNLDNIHEIDNIEKLNFKNYQDLKPVNFEKVPIGFGEIFEDDNNLENLTIISEGQIEYDDGSIKIIQNTRLVVKISECNLLSAGNGEEIDKIPELFFKKKI